MIDSVKIGKLMENQRSSMSFQLEKIVSIFGEKNETIINLLVYSDYTAICSSRFHFDFLA